MANIVKKDAKPAKVKKPKKPNIFIRIGHYFKDVWGELKKVSWPTFKEMVSYTGTVIVFVLAVAAIIGILDFLFLNMVQLLGKI